MQSGSEVKFSERNVVTVRASLLFLLHGLSQRWRMSYVDSSIKFTVYHCLLLFRK